jgi:hypothetical protein
LALKIDSGVEALQEQGAKHNQSTQDVKSGVQSLQRQTADISQAMEQAKLRASHVSGVSKRGKLILKPSLCRGTSSKDLQLAGGA